MGDDLHLFDAARTGNVDTRGWAEFFHRPDLVAALNG